MIRPRPHGPLRYPSPRWFEIRRKDGSRQYLTVPEPESGVLWPRVSVRPAPEHRRHCWQLELWGNQPGPRVSQHLCRTSLDHAKIEALNLYQEFRTANR